MSLVLGIESSCDESSAAVVADGLEILSNVVASQDARHAPYGGVVPEVASRAHAEVMTEVIARAIERSGAGPEDLMGIAVANRPGLLGSLLVGLTAAKAIALAWDKPMVAVNHLEAHLYTSRWADGLADAIADGSAWPMVGLVASGGHTSLYLCESFFDIRRIGATTDDAAGEAFDKVASVLGLSYPGGPSIEKASADVDPGSVAFTRPRVKGRRFDFTFSGLKTAVLYHVRGIPPGLEAIIPRDDFPKVAAAFQKTAVEHLVRNTIDAALHYGARSVTATGGVAANSLLRTELASAASRAGLLCAFPPKSLCTDNGAMVAGRGWHDLSRGLSDPLDIDADSAPERAARKVREKE